MEYKKVLSPIEIIIIIVDKKHSVFIDHIIAFRLFIQIDIMAEAINTDVLCFIKK